jgi:preprotein translocase subunit SecD
LDLRGGAHLILQVVVSEAVSAETDNTVGRIQQDLKAANLGFTQVYKPDPAKPTVIRVEGTPQASSSTVRSTLDTKYSTEYDLTGGGADNTWTLTMKPMIVTALEKKTVEQAIETIRDRVDTLGVSEPLIQQYGLGDNQILVELPGISDLDRVKSIIQSTARLEIHAVVGGPYPDEAAAMASVGGAVPPDEELVHGSGALATGSDADSVYVLHRVSVVAGSDFRSADPGTDSNTGQRNVRFTLTNEAGDRFYDYTSKNVNTSMAVVMGGRVKEVANIESAIRDSGEIRGSFSPEEVTILSKMLRTGALPASLNYLEDRTVGASLGADSIRQGVTAAIVGVLVVMAFMLFYYRGSGINADLALVMNLVILLGFMGVSTATLTLPGIAGVILTIGMGVDSNVLIFERIREEVRAGKAAAAAVDQGFAHAWVTIVDTHVTTIVSAAILFLFGTGPVKGFATTLTIGLLANLFTAVFVSRVIFDWHLNKLKPGEAVSI